MTQPKREELESLRENLSKLTDIQTLIFGKIVEGLPQGRYWTILHSNELDHYGILSDTKKQQEIMDLMDVYMLNNGDALVVYRDPHDFFSLFNMVYADKQDQIASAEDNFFNAIEVNRAKFRENFGKKLEKAHTKAQSTGIPQDLNISIFNMNSSNRATIELGANKFSADAYLVTLNDLVELGRDSGYMIQVNHSGLLTDVTNTADFLPTNTRSVAGVWTVLTVSPNY